MIVLAIILGAALAGAVAALVLWPRKLVAAAKAAMDAEVQAIKGELRERELREDTEDDRDRWMAQNEKTAAEKAAAIKRVVDLELEIKASRAAFAAYIAKKQQTASDEQAVTIMDDLIGRRLGA